MKLNIFVTGGLLISSLFVKVSSGLVIPKHPLGNTCTAHFRTITAENTNNSRTVVEEDFVAVNYGEFIWTFWNTQNTSLILQPVIPFHESCTLSILFDGGIKVRQLHPFLYNSNYAKFYDDEHSVFLVIRTSCSLPLIIFLKHLPLRLFLYVVNCKRINSNSFRTGIFVPVNKFEYAELPPKKGIFWTHSLPKSFTDVFP